MPLKLSPVQVRVLGCLLEKELLTPDHYPLTLNSLTLACNQKSSRDPVTELDEAEVEEALDELRDLHLALRVDAAGSRTAKFRHHLEHHHELDKAHRAVLAVLLLRGAQTVGELRTRTERLYGFGTLDEVAAVVQDLCTEEPEALAVALPRQPGRKEIRFMHTFGEVEIGAVPVSNAPATSSESGLRARVAALEARVAALEEKLGEAAQEPPTDLPPGEDVP